MRRSDTGDRQTDKGRTRKEFWSRERRGTRRVVFPPCLYCERDDEVPGPGQDNSISSAECGFFWLAGEVGRVAVRDRPAETLAAERAALILKVQTRLAPLGYSRHASRSALNAFDPEGRVSIGVEAPLRESPTVFTTSRLPRTRSLSNDLIAKSLSPLFGSRRMSWNLSV